MKFKFLMWILLVLSLSVPTISFASCVAYGTVTWASIDENDGVPDHGIYVRESALSTYKYYFNYNLDDKDFGSMAATAYATKARVRIYGNASSCPTSGSNRYGGYITQFYFD